MKVMDRMSFAAFCGIDGALLRIQPLNKLEAQELASRHGISLIHPKPYTSDKITSALGVAPVDEPFAEQNEPILVCDVLGYNHVRFFLVEKLGNASGLTTDGEVLLTEYGLDEDDGIDPFEGDDNA